MAFHAPEGPSTALDVSGPFGLSIEAGVGILEGEAGELVYESDFLGNRYKLSELQWDLKSVFMAGLGASLHLTPGFSLNAAGWTAIDEGDGELVDYDWLILPDEWSDRSISPVTVENATLFDVNARLHLIDLPVVSLHGIAGYKSDTWEWDAVGGTYVYSVNGFRDDIGVFEDTSIIQYEQTFSIPYAGLGATAALSPFSLQAYVLYSPLVSAEDRDYHVLRDTLFEETFEEGDFLALGVSGRLELPPMFFIGASMDYQEIPEFIGDTTIFAEGESETIPDSAGISSRVLMVSGRAGMRF